MAWPSATELATEDLQWFHNDQPIPGAVTTELALDPLTLLHSGNYEARTASTRSNIIVLNVAPARPALVKQTFDLPLDGSNYRFLHYDADGTLYVFVSRPDGNHILAHQNGTLRADFDIALEQRSVSFLEPLSGDRYLVGTSWASGSFEISNQTVVFDNVGQASAPTLRYDTHVAATARLPSGALFIGQNLHDVTGNYRHVIHRLRADGSVDPTYARTNSRAGVLYHLLPIDNDSFVAVILDPGNNGNRRFRIERYRADGSAYPGFHTFYSADIIRLHTALPDGRFVIGIENRDAAGPQNVQRLNADGTWDSAAGILSRYDRHPLRVTRDGTLFDRVGVNSDGNIRCLLRRIQFPGTSSPPAPFDDIGASTSFDFYIDREDRIVTVGDFVSFGGVPTSHAAVLDSSYISPPLPPSAAIEASVTFDDETYQLRTATLSTSDQPAADTTIEWLALDGPTPADPASTALTLTAGTRGRFQLRATNAVGSTYSRIVTIPATAPSPILTNLSARIQIPPTGDPATLGFISRDSPTTPGVPALLFRGIGPGLAPYLDSATVADPQITLRSANGSVLAYNDNWAAELNSAFAQTGAFPLSTGSNDAAIVTTIPAGLHTLQLWPLDESTAKAGLLEAYLAGDGQELHNLSVRAFTETGDHALIAGFALAPPLDQLTAPRPARLLIRAIGPGLQDYGITSHLPNPRLQIFDHENRLIAENVSWSDATDPAELKAVMSSIGAFPLTEDSADAALIIELPSGVYTAVVSPADGQPGTALLELYLLP
ncbi:hypothetical protein [Actomonas aquatica]|uniref:Ig-like domain-containing protein n=1 Tax=Actomonas aquatica TaxID=2866162 RepID=A0ABZ1CBI0_9BACT|nr:hypothetical protein [Opitutus sp. WL0086]WRQ88772.1 hypothetical protein K1X11_005105 [Opitutus sp. WL0086]